MTGQPPDDVSLIYVRATVHLPGDPPLRPGNVVLVDPTVAYIAAQLAAQTLVPLPADMQPTSR